MTGGEPHGPVVRGHVPALDGVRGIAIALVLGHHLVFFGGMRPAVLVDKIVYAVMQAGWVGVDLFFVLSGYLITGILLDTRSRPHYFRNFYARRILRIFPLYYGVLFTVFVVIPHVMPVGDSFRGLLATQWWYWTYLLNIWIGARGWPTDPMLGHFWSLAIEEQFYLAWPLVVFVLGRKSLMRACLVVLMMSLLVRILLREAGYSTAAYVLTPARMDVLATGAWLALLVRAEHGPQLIRRWAGPIAAAAGAGLLGIFALRGGLYAQDAVAQTVGYSLLAVLCGALVATAAVGRATSALGQALASPPVRMLGRYSYAIYIFHLPIIFLAVRHSFSAATVPAVLGSHLPGLLVFILAAGGTSLVGAVVSWRFYESKFLNLKRLFASSPSHPADGRAESGIVPQEI